MKLNKLAAAVALVAASAGANASWNVGVGLQDTTADGELLLTLWNSNLETSVSIDLGGSVSSFLSGNASSQTWTLSAADLDYVGGAAAASDIKWSIVGSSSVASGPQDTVGIGFYYTSNDAPSVTKPATVLVNDFIKTSELQQIVTGELPTDQAFDASVNTSYQLSGGVTYAGFGAVYGDTSRGVTTSYGAQSGSAYANETLNAWSSHLAAGFQSPSVNTQDVNFWQLDLAAGTVSYVPVPAAAWLFGSALLGLAGVVRRKKSA